MGNKQMRAARGVPTTEYVRFQPRGTSLFRHTSDTSEGRLPPGYVFAYRGDNLIEVFGDWSAFHSKWRRTAASMEVITFLGSGAFDPGDAEGIAVRPRIIVRRETMEAWLKRQVRDNNDPEVRDAAQEALEE